MEAINDFTWLNQMLAERVLERFRHGDYRIVALEITPSERNPSGQYRFRMLLFYRGDNKPSHAFNLESTILGSFCLTEQAGRVHRTVGPADETMSYAQFRAWALERIELATRERAPRPGRAHS